MRLWEKSVPEVVEPPKPTLRFEFPVTWAYLSKPRAAETPDEPVPAKSKDRWEMVVPKMGRPIVAAAFQPLPAPSAAAPTNPTQPTPQVSGSEPPFWAKIPPV